MRALRMKKSISPKFASKTLESEPDHELRPGPISQSNLYSNGQHLRSNLIEHHDFEVVSLDLWRHLVAWYSLAPNSAIITRPAVLDKRSKKLKADLYYEFRNKSF